MKRMIDQSSFEKASSDIKEIQDLLSGKAFFDGSVTVENIGGYKGIKKANLPTEAGAYKLSSGILIVKANSASSITITAMYGASMYAETRDPDSSNNFLFNENTRLGEKPLYYHPIYVNNTDANLMCAFAIINNDPTPFNNSNLQTFLDSVDFNITPISGTLVLSGNTYDLHRIFTYKDGAKYIYGYNRTNPQIVNALEITSIWSSLFTKGVTDTVNRIN